MLTALQIRRAIKAKKAEASALLAACEGKGGVVRALTPEESERFDTLMADVDNLKTQMARLAQVEVDEEEVDEEEAEQTASARSTRSSAPDQFEGQSPAVHSRKRPYRLLRALQFAIDGRRPDGLEGEISAEVRRSNPGKKYRGQFSMPIDPEPELRALMYPGAKQRTDLTTTSGAGGIFTVPELPMIDLLRPRMVIARLGATFLTGMQGLFAIPRQSAKSTVNWIGEGTAATPSTATLDQVPFSPKVAVDLTNISRAFINQTSVSAETFAMNDLAKTMAVEWDRVSINGLGSGSSQPLGIMQNTTIQTNSAALQVGTNGGPLAWSHCVNHETQVSDFNAEGDGRKLAYLTSPAIRGTLKNTPKISASTFPVFIWQDGNEPGVGEINSYPAYTTTNVPRNLTKGSGTNLSALIFGNWEDLVVASWADGIDFLVNPYSNQASAAVTISMEMSVDSEVRHPESFSVTSDASYNAF